MWKRGIIPYDISQLKRKGYIYVATHFTNWLTSAVLSDRKLYQKVKHDIRSLNKMLYGCIKFR